MVLTCTCNCKRSLAPVQQGTDMSGQTFRQSTSLARHFVPHRVLTLIEVVVTAYMDELSKGSQEIPF